MDRTCICIDLKSYYASVECVARGLDPLKARLLVADETRSDQTICLAVSPALKAIGVPARPRLFEAKQAIARYDARRRTKTQYYIAPPRMAEYERVSALIFSIYLHYVAPEDIHVYSIDEAFIDCTRYLSRYERLAAAQKRSRKRADAGAHLQYTRALIQQRLIRDLLRHPGGGEEVLPHGFGEAELVPRQKRLDFRIVRQIHRFYFLSFNSFSKACRCGSCPGSASTRMLPR